MMTLMTLYKLVHIVVESEQNLT